MNDRELLLNFRKDIRIRRIAICEILSFVGVIIIKGVLRPMHLGLSDTGIFLMGTLPNFFAATGFVALFFLISEIHSDKVAFLKSSVARLNASTALTIVGLSVWEVIETLFGSRIDPYDIAMTIAGSLCSYLFIQLAWQPDKGEH